jgi:hypothetical protein
MTQEEIAAAYDRIFGGLHPTPQDAFRAGVVVGIASGVMHATPCLPGTECARHAQGLGGCRAGVCGSNEGAKEEQHG